MQSTNYDWKQQSTNRTGHVHYYIFAIEIENFLEPVMFDCYNFQRFATTSVSMDVHVCQLRKRYHHEIIIMKWEVYDHLSGMKNGETRLIRLSDYSWPYAYLINYLYSRVLRIVGLCGTPFSPTDHYYYLIGRVPQVTGIVLSCCLARAVKKEYEVE